MDLLGHVALLAFEDNPGQGQGTTMIDHTEHQGQTVASNHTTIHAQGERLLNEVGEQSLGNGKKPGLDSLTVVLEEASKSGDEAFLVGTMGGSMVGNRGEMRMAGAT